VLRYLQRVVVAVIVVVVVFPVLEIGLQVITMLQVEAVQICILVCQAVVQAHK
jgi:hypothetical protein